MFPKNGSHVNCSGDSAAARIMDLKSTTKGSYATLNAIVLLSIESSNGIPSTNTSYLMKSCIAINFSAL